MLTFIARRLVALAFVLLGASILMYGLIAIAGNPLDDLIASSAPNKAQLIASRTELLQLDLPLPQRYLAWLTGAAGCLAAWVPGVAVQCDLGSTLAGLQTSEVVANALFNTLQLLAVATVLAIFLGIAIGISSALRQYSGFDYGVTFGAFLAFSLPVFVLAVMLKEFVAIDFNDFLADPTLSPTAIVVTAAIAGVIAMSALGGDLRRRAATFLAGAVVVGALLAYLNAVGWFADPGIPPTVLAVLGVAIALGVVTLSVGLRRGGTLYAALLCVALGVALYYPIQYVFVYASIWVMIGLAVATAVVGGSIGYAMGGYDRAASARTSAITSLGVAGLLVLDRFMRAWPAYNGSGAINNRPIATIGAANPQFSDAGFWIIGVDKFTHLLLPSIALMLISLASYSRYSRSSLLEVMNQDYIRTARAKGLTERTVVMRHAFRNSLIPITTIVAFDIGGLIGGAVITETVFGWTGMGQLFVNSLRVGPDPNPLMAVFIITGAVAVVFNLLADLSYALLDPRIRVNA